MPASLENSVVATGQEKVRFDSNPKERQCQRMFKLLHNCTTYIPIIKPSIKTFPNNTARRAKIKIA